MISELGFLDMGMVGLPLCCGVVCVALSVHTSCGDIRPFIYSFIGISIVSEGSVYISGVLIERIWIVWHALFLY